MGSSVILPQPGQPVEGPDPHFTSGSQPNVVTYKFQNLEPPTGLYIQRDDWLNTEVVTNQPNEVVNFNVRLLLAQGPRPGQPLPPGVMVDQNQFVTGGTIVTCVFPVKPTALRVTTFPFQSLWEGYLLSATAQATVALTRGQTFIRMDLTRGNAPFPGVASPQAQSLVHDYVTAAGTVGFPGTRVIGPTEGPGWIHSLQVPNPAAGADWTLTTLANQRLRVESLTAVFTASATVANRTPELIWDDGGNIMFVDDVNANIVAGQVIQVSSTGTNIPTGVVTTILHVTMPPGMILVPGHRVRTNTPGIQAGDQWSAIFLNVEEWIDNT